MDDYHVVVYASQGGRVIHPEFVVARPNLSQDTRTTVHTTDDGNLNIIIWWMYDQFSKAQLQAHTDQIINTVKLKLGASQS